MCALLVYIRIARWCTVRTTSKYFVNFGYSWEEASGYITLDRFLITVANCFPWPEDELIRTSFIGVCLYHLLISKMNESFLLSQCLNLQFLWKSPSIVCFLKDAETHYTNPLLNFRNFQKYQSKNTYLSCWTVYVTCVQFCH